jgi:hypothetical protein
MKRPLKAALLSALVFPGSGHIYLQHHKTGYSILAIAFICLCVVIENTVSRALSIFEQLQKGGGIIDINQITELATQSAQHSSPLFVQVSVNLLIICWLFGIIDAYRLANKKTDENHN